MWTHITLSSPLHVFLPLWDMGIDGVVRVPGTDINVAVQVKSRNVLSDGKLHLRVHDHELTDPRAMIVAVVVDRERAQLHDTAICVDVATFRRLAFRHREPDPGYQASIPFPPHPDSRWFQHAVAIGELGRRLCPAAAEMAVTETPLPTAATPSSGVGNRGEARLIALLTADSRLNVFKAFPDRELSEYLVRHVGTGMIAGVQVKAVSVDAQHPSGTVGVPPNTFRATPFTYFTILAEQRADRSLHPQCLLVPSMDMGDLLVAHGGKLTLSWDPDSTRRDAGVAPYRCPAEELAGRLASLLE